MTMLPLAISNRANCWLSIRAIHLVMNDMSFKLYPASLRKTVIYLIQPCSSSRVDILAEIAYQNWLPGTPLNGPLRSEVIQPP